MLFQKVTAQEVAIFYLSQVDRLDRECPCANECSERCGPVEGRWVADTVWREQGTGRECGCKPCLSS